MRILGILLVLFGLLLLLTIVGAGLGLILIIIGFLFIALGGGRRTIIRNVVRVTNVAPGAVDPELRGERGRGPAKELPARSEPQLIAGSARRIDAFEPEYDDDEADFTDLKNEISLAAKQALARLHSNGFSIKAKPDRIEVSRDDFAQALHSNAAIIDFTRKVGLL